MKHLVVLISGEGSNLQALIDACQYGKISAQISAVISNRANAYGLVRAAIAGIKTIILNPADFANREDYDRGLAALIDQYSPDVIVLAGFMRILTQFFVERYAGRVLNIHPSLLPKYPGLKTHRRVLANGDTEHGASVHFVAKEVDSGPVILQAMIHTSSQDSEQLLVQKVKMQEHTIYPLAINWLLTGRLVLRDNVALMDGMLLPSTGWLYPQVNAIEPTSR